jgi:hypothetical protein
MKSLVTLVVFWSMALAAIAWDAGTTPYIEGQVIVRFNHPINSLDEAQWLMGANKYLVKQTLVKALDIYLIELTGNTTVQQALVDLEDLQSLKWAQANHKLKERTTFPNDPSFSNQWDMHNTGQSGGTVDADIDAPEAWDLGTGGTDPGGNDIVVAIVDGGMELTHSNLVPNLWVNQAEAVGTPGVDDDNNGYIDDVNGWDAYANDGSIPTSGHGTHVAGTVGAKGNDNSQVCGVSWDVKLMAVAASTSQTSVASIGYGYVLDQKILWINSGGTAGANVVATNSSFGIDNADCTSGSYPIWNDLYTAMGDKGILSAAATANANTNIDQVGDVPTGCDSEWIISVTNTTSSDNKNSGAAYGATTIDLGAPGTGILSTYTSNSTSSLTGTSMATPHVAGAVGFLHSVASPGFYAEYLADPAQGALTLKQLIMDNVDPLAALNGITVSGGRLNLHSSALEISAYGGNLLSGMIETETSALPIEGVSVSADPGGRSTISDENGYYLLALQPGMYTVEYSAFGYNSLALPITIPSEGDVTQDASLTESAMALLDGVLFDSNDDPVNGGEITVHGVPLPAHITGPDGYFNFLLPAGETYSIRSRTAPGVIHDPQDADSYGYRAYDPGDTDWQEIDVLLEETGVTQNIRGANHAIYSWITIDPDQGGSGTTLDFTSDDQTLQINLPFDFMYYGQTFTELSICGNGWLALGTTSSTDYRGLAIPDNAEPDAVLAAFWEDLSPQQPSSGNISYFHDPAGRLIIEFFDIRQYSPDTDFERFQVILLDPDFYPTQSGDGAIVMQYAAVGQTDNTTVGIENPSGDDGLQYFYGRSDGFDTPGGSLPETNPAIADGLSLLFTTGMLPAEPNLQAIDDLMIEVIGLGSVRLDWTDVPAADSYRVEMSSSSEGTWEVLANTAVSEYYILVSDGTHLFRVIAIRD